MYRVRFEGVLRLDIDPIRAASTIDADSQVTNPTAYTKCVKHLYVLSVSYL